MAKRIDVTKVVDDFNALKNEDSKINYAKGLVYRHYVPFGEKYMVLKGMLDKATYTNDNGIKYINMLIFKIDYMLAIISMYTIIDLKKDTNDKISAFDSYDLLVSSKLLSFIINQIGDTEISEIDDINKSLIDTFENENNNIANYTMTQLNNMTRIISETLNGNLSKIFEIVSDEKEVSMLKKKINSLLEKK